MIHHISFSALDPRTVAQALGEVFLAPALPAPPPFPDGSFVVPLMDEQGTFLEIVPHGTVLRAGEGGEPAGWTSSVEGTFNPNHAFISTRRSVEELVALGESRGWRTVLCDRGAFRLVEMWIENRQMLELVTQTQLQAYLGVVRAVAAALPLVPPGTVEALPAAAVK